MLCKYCNEATTGRAVVKDESFINVFFTFEILFLSTFSLVSPTAGSVAIHTCIDNDSDTNRYFTLAVGTTLLYMVFFTTFILFMYSALICTAVNMYQNNTKILYTEWICGRTQIFLFFSTVSELPPPLNIIPTVHCLSEAWECLKNCCKTYNFCTANSFISFVGYTEEPRPEEEFREFMVALVRRYYRSES